LLYVEIYILNILGSNIKITGINKNAGFPPSRKNNKPLPINKAVAKREKNAVRTKGKHFLVQVV
jgi:hypothetical protein